MELLHYTASLPRGSRQCNSCNKLPHCLTAWGQWAVELLQHTASLPGGSGQWNSCNIRPYCLSAVGSRTPAMHCLTA